jgi:hypothetical protein
MQNQGLERSNQQHGTDLNMPNQGPQITCTDSRTPDQLDDLLGSIIGSAGVTAGVTDVARGHPEAPALAASSREARADMQHGRHGFQKHDAKNIAEETDALGCRLTSDSVSLSDTEVHAIQRGSSWTSHEKQAGVPAHPLPSQLKIMAS